MIVCLMCRYMQSNNVVDYLIFTHFFYCIIEYFLWQNQCLKQINLVKTCHCQRYAWVDMSVTQQSLNGKLDPQGVDFIAQQIVGY